MKIVELCPLCKSRNNVIAFNSEDYITEDFFNIFRCTDCDFFYTSPVPNREEDLKKYYPEKDYYGSKSGNRFNFLIEKAIYIFRLLRVRKILSYKKSGHVLDVGCGRGDFLKILKDMDFECTGTELSSSLGGYIKENYGIEVFNSSVKECNFKDNTFDVINIYHVLEHIEDPKETLKELKRIIKPDGILIIALPDAGSFQAGMSKGKWFHLDVPRHLTHFSYDRLKSLLQNLDIEIIQTNRFSLEYDVYGLIQSILNMAGCSPNFLYKLLKKEKMNFLEFKTLFYDLPVSIFLPFLLFFPSLAAEYMLTFIDLNGTMEVYCKKI